MTCKEKDSRNNLKVIGSLENHVATMIKSPHVFGTQLDSSTPVDRTASMISMVDARSPRYIASAIGMYTGGWSYIRRPRRLKGARAREGNRGHAGSVAEGLTARSVAEGPKAEDRACATLLHRLVLRVPKVMLEILGAYREDPFRAIFGLELDCAKLWRRESLGAGVNQPEDPWEVRERLVGYQPEHPWEVRERLLHRLVLWIPKAT